MSEAKRRRGFTLVEMMVSVGLMTIVIAPLSVVTYQVFQFMKSKSEKAEFAVKFRNLRENIYFRAGNFGASGGAERFYGGLLSATNLNEASEFMPFTGERITYPYVVGKSGDLASFRYADALLGLPDAYDITLVNGDRGYDPTLGEVGAGRTNLMQYLKVVARVMIDGRPVVHTNRMVVPVFGQTQQYLDYGLDRDKVGTK